jgi:hypothetical protein
MDEDEMEIYSVLKDFYVKFNEMVKDMKGSMYVCFICPV